MPEVSVVVPTTRPRDRIEALDALSRGSFEDYEVLVRDEPTVTQARNRGVEAASADKLVFLDDDSRPREDYLARAAALLDDEHVVAGRAVHPRDDVVARLAGHYDFGDDGRYVTRFWGCNAAMRREVFEAVGGWNDAVGWGHEEKELAERIRREFPIYYDPELVVDHPYADSVPDYWRKRYALGRATPRYWAATDVPRRAQWLRVARGALQPASYLGRSVPHAVARAGGTVAGTLGRLRSMLDDDRAPGNERREQRPDAGARDRSGASVPERSDARGGERTDEPSPESHDSQTDAPPRDA